MKADPPFQTLLSAIENTANAAPQITTPDNVSAVATYLLNQLKPFPLLSSHGFEDLGNGPGIYLIDIQFPHRSEAEYVAFLQRWGAKGANDLQKSTSRAYRNRAGRHLQKVAAGEFVPLYVGKNKNVRSRVAQHLVGKAESGTYGLKLLSRAPILEGCQLRASSVTFDIPPAAYFCMALLEAAIRERLHPIIGKQ